MNVHLPFIDATAPIQADRILRIETPLGPDVVLPERFELTEGIGGFEAEGSVRPGEAGLFTGRIAVRSPRYNIAPGELVGRMVDVSVELSAEPPVRRTWHCLVSELLVGPPVTRGLRSYRLTLRPAHWLLTRRKDCRIWQNQTSLDVVRTLLSEHGLAAPVTDGIINPPPPQAYSVQLNESDWAFLCRRLEQDGCAWWVRHEGGTIGSVAATARLHIASYVSGYTESDHDDGRIRYAAGSTDRNHITRFDTAFSFVPGARAGADWNFLTPGMVTGAETSVPSLVDLPGGALGSNADYESFEYPSVGGYGTGEGADGASEGITDGEVERLERLRAQAHEAGHARVEGEGTVRTLAPGQKFTPYDVPAEMGLADLLGSASDGATDFVEYIVLTITHRAIDQSYESQGGAPEYGCTFTALPAKTPATPHRRTPRPRIDGQQIGIVAGPEGEEIHTDRFGRIKLWFPWDRRANKDGTDTCWVRVAQSWAGTGWGAQTIPRIGMEALVTYLDGDPDRPVVTGLVPNPRQKVPYKLPENKTRSVMRSDSYKQTGFNELTFEDAGGRENLFIHAQKDQTNRILNTQATRVGSHRVTSVGGSHALEVRQNEKHEVGGSLSRVVGALGAQARMDFNRYSGMAAVTAKMLRETSERNDDADGVAELASAVEAWDVGFYNGRSEEARIATSGAAGVEKDAGGKFGDDATRHGDELDKLMSEPGVLNSLIARFRTDTIGVARVEQVGAIRVSNVGKAESINVGENQITTVGTKQETHVGSQKTIHVGETFDIEVGERFSVKVGGTTLVMNADGRITLKGARMTVLKGGGAGLVIGPGPVLYSPVLVKGAAPGVNGPGVPKLTRKPFAEECQGDSE